MNDPLCNKLLAAASILLFFSFVFSMSTNAQDDIVQIEPDPEKLEKLKTRFPKFEDIYSTTESHSFIYNSDGLRIKGYLSEPSEPGKYPIVIFNRGGNRSFGELNDIRALVFLSEIASHGYVVFASNYRGSTDSEGQEEFGGADVNDVLNLIPIAQKHEKANPEKMGVIGWSRGGMMTYRTLMESCDFDAAIVGAGMANFFRTAEERPEMETGVFAELIPNFEEDREAAMKSRSAVYNIDKLCVDTPILILHGSADWRVSPRDALEMADSLYAHKHPFRLHFYEGGDHGLNEFEREVMRNMISFLDDYLKDKRQAPNLEPHGK